MQSIRSITNRIKDLFNSALRAPANIINPLLIVCSALRRPGLSVIISCANIIADLEKQGIPTGPNPDGSPNLTNVMVCSITSEIFRALKEDCNIQIGIGPGNIVIGGVGGGTNANHVKGVGILQ